MRSLESPTTETMERLTNSILTTNGFEDLDSDFLEHYGREGMKWYQHIYGKEQSHAKYAEKTSKKDQRMAKKAQKIAEKESRRKEKILQSPTKTYKHRREFTKAEMDEALKTFEWESKLSTFARNEFGLGEKYLNMLLKYGTTIVGLYALGEKGYGIYKKLK